MLFFLELGALTGTQNVGLCPSGVQPNEGHPGLNLDHRRRPGEDCAPRKAGGGSDLPRPRPKSSGDARVVAPLCSFSPGLSLTSLAGMEEEKPRLSGCYSGGGGEDRCLRMTSEQGARKGGPVTAVHIRHSHPSAWPSSP